MRSTFRSLAAVCAAALLAAGMAAHAQDYPTRPIRVIIPYAPGGTDQQLRIMAPALHKLLGQNIVIENIGGGGTIRGASALLAAPADGYTLMYTGTGALTVIPNLVKTPYKREDFVAIGNVIGTPFVVAARPDLPYKTLAEFIAYARANPGKVSFGSAGAGTTTHMAGEAIAAAVGSKMLHVPYQGIGPAVQSILGGNVDIVVGLPNAIMPHVNAGKLVALAITGPQRSDLMPNLMTLREGGLDVVDVTKFAFFAPRGTPEAVIKKLEAVIPEAMKAPEFVDNTRRSFNSTLYLSPAQMQPVLDAEDAHFKKLIRDLKIEIGS